MRHSFLLLTAAALLGVTACTDDTQTVDPIQVAAPPAGTSGSVNSGSSSNAASGSTVRAQEPPVAGANANR
jgi:hypothetical protein